MKSKTHTFYIALLFLISIIATIYLIVDGWTYYLTPISERFWNANHNNLKPSGFLGHGIGIVGSLMMIIGVVVYMIRKRVKRFVRSGALKHWLEFHIFLCSLGPILILFHTAFKFGGIVVVSFWSMIAVVISGIVGRFIYIQIPRSIQGKEFDIKELNEMMTDINYKLKMEYDLDDCIMEKINQIHSSSKFKNQTLGGSVLTVVKDYFATKAIIKNIKREIKHVNKYQRKAITKTIKNKIILSRRIGWLRSMQKLFKYWHVAHLPFAVIIFIIMFVHIIVAVTFGYKWIF